MGRRLKGSLEQNAGGTWTASLPVAKGAKQREQFTFPTQQVARSWLDAGIEAIDAGRALPDPERFVNLSLAVEPLTKQSGRFADVAWACWREEYDENPARSPGAAAKVEAVLRLWVVPYFELAVQDISQLRREHVKMFIKIASGRAPFITATPNHDPIPKKQYARSTRLTIEQASNVTGQSRSSVLRHYKAGHFPNAVRIDIGQRQSQVRIPFGDVIDSGITFRTFSSHKPGRIRQGIGSGGSSRKYQIAMLSALRLIVVWAKDKGLMDNDPTQYVQALHPKASTELTKPNKRKPTVFSIQQCADVATHLHTHYQMVMWIQRLLGLRVSEVFGLRVSDFFDLGNLAILEIHRQGGKSFWERDEDDRPVKVDEVDSTKTPAGQRTLVVPRQLTEAIRVYVRAFHVDPVTGNVNPNSRLIVGLKDPNRAGGSSYGERLKVAFIAAGLGPLDVDFSAGSHHLRKSLSTDIRYQTTVAEALRSEIIGHRLSAKDGGAEVTMRIYTLAMPVLKPLEDAAREIDGLIKSAGVPLLVPSAKKPGYSRGHYLRRPEWASQVDAVLADAQALHVREHYLTAAEAAQILGHKTGTITRWIRTGRLPATVVGASESQQPRYLIDPQTVDDLFEKLDGRLTVAEAAAEMGVEVFALYKAAQRGKFDVEREGHRIFVRRSQLPTVAEVLKGPQDLYERSMTLTEAAQELGVAYAAAAQSKKIGHLEGDPTAPDGIVYVTRESVAAEKQRRLAMTSPKNVDESILVDMKTAMRLTGLSHTEVLQLTHAGVLIRRSEYKFLIDRGSLEVWTRKHPTAQ